MESSLRANPLDIRGQYEKQLKDLQEAYGEAMLELRARKIPGPAGMSHWIAIGPSPMAMRPRIEAIPSVATAPNAGRPT
ncbi:hypothetical protein ACFODY_08055, partial [Sinirhodobacter populi]